MGWLGWLPKQALATDVNMVLLALEGRNDLLKSIFGEAEEPGSKSGEPRGKVTAAQFRRFARRHNKRITARSNG